MRVMSWNIRHGLGTNRDTGKPDAIPDLERIARVIEAHQPELVGLQELDRNWERSGHVDQTAWLANRLGMDGVLGANVINGTAEYGVAILSRHPINDYVNVALPGGNGLEPRGCLVTVVDTPHCDIAFLTTHLQVTFGDDGIAAARERAESARTIADEIIAPAGMPAILTGDFNGEPTAKELAALAGLQDVWRVAGGDRSGHTFPAHPSEEPATRIDAIFTTADWHVSRAEVYQDDETRVASDHFPLVADLVLAGQS